MENLHGRTLWKAFIYGNDQAFEKVYGLYVDRLFAFGLKYHADRDLVKDCLQDLFTNLFYYRSNLNPEVNPLPYLFSSLRNNILARIKKEHRDQHLAYTFDLEWGPEMAWIKREEDRYLVSKLQEQIKKLPSRQREIVYLKFNEELRYEEIAEMLNISIPTCRTLVYRAIKQLREQMVDLPLAHVLCLFFHKKTSF